MFGTFFNNFKDQQWATLLCVQNWGVHRYRQARMIYKDIQDAGSQLLMRKTSGNNARGTGTILDAMADTSYIDEDKNFSESDVTYLQETYFGIAVLTLALSIGGIVGNLWTEFSWAPQLGVLQALLVIVLMPLQIWIGINDVPDRKPTRIAELYIKLFFMGFSMGRLCDYSLVIVAPRMFSCLFLAILIEYFGHSPGPTPPAKKNSSTPASKIIGTRLELFMAVAVAVFPTVWILIYLLQKMTVAAFLMASLSAGFTLNLLFIHFQLLYYAKYTLCERYQTETMKEDDPTHFWNLSKIKPWFANADIVYALAVLILDVMLAAIQDLIF